jgi:hypothetical protein
MQVFIVRPFGVKKIVRQSGGTPEIVDFDFDYVHKMLIEPALHMLNLDGGTTGRIFTAGEIREDMFSELLLADVVIADITVHNANVFYELGIRNALRDKTTVLINCPGYDMTPFDIIGYRYISYQKDKPEDALDDLKMALRESMSSPKKDSPVFNMLPTLQVPDTEKFFALPPDFTEEADAAFASRDVGELALMTREAAHFEWRTPAMRLLGKHLFRLNAFKAAQWAWEDLLDRKPNDYEANECLATIYQRLAEQEIKTNPTEAAILLQKSDEAIEHILEQDDSLSRLQQAQAYALKGRNAKTRWIADWSSASEEDRSAVALTSVYWEYSLTHYGMGYHTHLNHYYSGINVLGLLTAIICLAENQPEIWALRHESEDEAADRLKQLKKQKEKLSGALRYTIEAERSRLRALSKSDIWLDITHADYSALTAPNPIKVSYAYSSIIRVCDQLQSDAMIRQLLMYQSLGIVPENVKAALKVTGEQPNEELDNHYILFTGHMIDAPGRPNPRFPPQAEGAARKAIEARVKEIMTRQSGKELIGIAGGACGGDILFHEVCREQGIKSELYLSLPREAFLNESVSFAGQKWAERFDKLYTTLPHRILSQTKAIPAWLEKRKPYDFWSRANLWMLYNALGNGALNMTLIALWDGKGGDGEGGTAHMVSLARQYGSATEHIDMCELLASA